MNSPKPFRFLTIGQRPIVNHTGAMASSHKKAPKFLQNFCKFCLAKHSSPQHKCPKWGPLWLALLWGLVGQVLLLAWIGVVVGRPLVIAPTLWFICRIGPGG